MAAKPPAELKPLAWVGSAKRDLLALPEEVIDAFGYVPFVAQTGKRHEKAKALHGFGPGAAGGFDAIAARVDGLPDGSAPGCLRLGAWHNPGALCHTAPGPEQ